MKMRKAGRSARTHAKEQGVVQMSNPANNVNIHPDLIPIALNLYPGHARAQAAVSGQKLGDT